MSYQYARFILSTTLRPYLPCCGTYITGFVLRKRTPKQMCDAQSKPLEEKKNTSWDQLILFNDLYGVYEVNNFYS